MSISHNYLHSYLRFSIERFDSFQNWVERKKYAFKEKKDNNPQKAETNENRYKCNYFNLQVRARILH